jgi:serine/threonine kinase 16
MLSFQSLGCLLYALCFYHSPYDAVYERGDSVALAVQSGSKNVRFPGNTTFSAGLRDLIILMLNPEFRDRPFVAEIINRVQLLMEVDEDRL